MCEVKPSLFGITNSNRDFAERESWGKNKFNSSFPAALACYLYSKNMSAVYFTTDSNMSNRRSYLDIETLYGTNPLGNDIYFSFETQYTPFQRYVVGSIPRNDLVIMSNDGCISSLEIKLVAVPDNTTCCLADNSFGGEIVIRPDTIIYLACMFIECYNEDRRRLLEIINGVGDNIEDWTNANDVLEYIYDIYLAIKRLVEHCNRQVPVVMEPIWKTEGKSPRLSDNCLDIFVWSNCGLLNLFMPTEEAFIYNNGIERTLPKITRHTRTMIWLFKMIKDYAVRGRFDGSKIIDELSYNTKNDKAFSTNGAATHPLMTCEELTRPRITKDEIKNIILGGGQNLLSPERRFDAIIYNSPDLFE